MSKWDQTSTEKVMQVADVEPFTNFNPYVQANEELIT